MQHYDIQFQVNRPQNRIKSVAFPGVDGRSTLNMGGEPITIIQTGRVLIERTLLDPGNTVVKDLWYDDEPELWAGTKLVDVHTGEGVYSGCRLVSVHVEQETRRILRYQYTWEVTNPNRVIHAQQENTL